MILINKVTNVFISEIFQIVDNYFKRLKGLMFTKELPVQNALQIIPCKEIHTFFMNYSIDVLYVDSDNNIVSIDESLKPGKIGRFVKNAASVIELPEGKIAEFDIKAGQTVTITNEIK